MDFPFLTFARGFHQLTRDANGGAGGHFGDVVVAGDAGIGNTLDVGQAGAVIHFQEGKLFGVTAGADPAFDGNGVFSCLATEGVFNERSHACDNR